MAPRGDTARRCAGAGLCLGALILLSAAALLAEPKFPALIGRVVDDAGILSPATVNNLVVMLAAHERATGEQVVVVTLPSLQGYSIEEFGYQLGRYWGIGEKGKNNGVLLIVAPKERKVRIEVGYGLEGELTDAKSSLIIQRDILPQFRRGDFDSGVLAGTRAILKVLSGEPEGTSPPGGARPSNASSIDPWLVVGLFGIWLMYVLLMRAMTRNPRVIRRIGRSRYIGPGPFHGGFGSGSSGGFSGAGGGFTGGGGSFGGGGASGSW
jgi:uncharacterized protein